MGVAGARPATLLRAAGFYQSRHVLDVQNIESHSALSKLCTAYRVILIGSENGLIIQICCIGSAL